MDKKEVTAKLLYYVYEVLFVNNSVQDIHLANARSAKDGVKC